MSQAANWELHPQSPTEAETRAVPWHEADRLADRKLGLGRAILLGSLIGFLTVATIVVLIGLLAGWDARSAIGIGRSPGSGAAPASAA
jgi:hypothetical protein